MKKFILTLILCCLSTFNLFAQDKYYTYLNAKKLDSIFTESALKNGPTNQCVDGDILKYILGKNYVEGKYFSEDNPFFFIQQEVDSLKGFKSFLDKYRICENDKEEKEIPTSNYIYQNSIKEFMNSNELTMDSRSSSNWQTAILQGTADFMAQRFKDELTNFALNSLIANTKKKDSLKFKILFPRTLSYVDTYLGPNSSKGFYYSDLNMLRYTAELDLNNIIDQLPEFIDSQSGAKYKSNFFRLNSEIIDDPKKFSNPKNIFDELAKLNNHYRKFKDTTLLNSSEINKENFSTIQNEKRLYLLDIFVNGLKKEGEEATDIWVDGSDVNDQIISEDLTVRFYYALLYEQTKNIFDWKVTESYSSSSDGNKPIEITRNARNDERIEIASATADELKRLTRKAIGRFDTIEKAYKNFETKEGEPEVSDYENLFIPALETIDRFTTDDTPKLKNITPSLLPIEQAIANKDYEFILPYLFNLLDALKIGNELIDREFLNTISLIVNFTLVENAEDMKNLLNTYALPIGSSSLKRTGKSDISFNGYVGLTGGFETIIGDNQASLYNFGLTAPIGLSISHRYKKDWFIRSGSVFLGILDLGSLVNNSFDENVEINSDLSFQQFIVPSLGYFFNIKNSPFSIGFIGSYHFDSRTFTANGIEDEGLNVYRLNCSVLVDIPFFTLKHKN